MAELPSNVHLTLHPMYLSICGPWVYEDENHRTWLHLIIETGSVLQVLLRQVDYPSEHIALTTSLKTSHTMPSMWTLHHDSQYLDSMGRLWRIMQHVEDDMEVMILELIDNS
ncbi:T-cell leukemia/lymphoma protein 1A-like [Myotis daubentonii]|uniref:T-cell leukemia/lymphoma protein 1A-like n=1 Tax=Myotis daubentonii TaxID=98922 RepID=UPI0028737C1D|nr:T-cell leukemia/lymphoma protein 1A-like [Myotis daubentonii]